jgi:hypothetical protein
MNLGSKIWGPKAWHLLHAFSSNYISNDKSHNYYLFYITFIYILPCVICSEHYAEILYNENILDEEKIDKEYINRWVFDTHNLVNKKLKKNIYDYEYYKNNFKVINHNDIFFIFKYFILNIDFKNISLYKFDQIINFVINFYQLYPNKKKRIMLKKFFKKENFNNISTPNEFIKWFKININKLEEIICSP